MFKQLFGILVFVQICLAVDKVNHTTPLGTIQGWVNTTTRHGATMYSFGGIPFAVPPIGNLRFQPPVPIEPANWPGGYLDATQYKNQCVQFKPGTENLTGSEDCLYLNVFTPNITCTTLSPVLVYVPGGGFMEENSTGYPMDLFVEKGIVGVIGDYRVGPFGFLSFEDDVCPGNFGLKDIVLILKWVKQNIQGFCGDPNNVTVFGQSAGAASIHILMQTNITEGLFQKALLSSGTSLNLWALETQAAEIATRIATLTNSLSFNHTTMLQNLRGVSVADLMSAANTAKNTIKLPNQLRGQGFGPVNENPSPTAVYVNPSKYALSQGWFHKIPVLVGYNSNEAASAGSLSTLVKIYFSLYQIAIQNLTPWSMTSNDFKRLQAGTLIKNKYFGWLGVVGFSENATINFISQDQFDRAVRKVAQLMALFLKLYFYVFDYNGPVQNLVSKYQGTGHSMELYFSFPSRPNSYSPEDLKVSECVVGLFSNFIKYGNPTPIASPQFNNTIWTPVGTNSSNMDYLLIQSSISMGLNPKQSDFVFYEDLFEQFGDVGAKTTTW